MVAKTDFRALRHVLVVENEPLMRDLLAKSVESAGFVVTTAANAADAMRQIKVMDPDAMVVDIELGPGPNGFDLADAVTVLTPEVGIVFLTNLPDPRFGGKDGTTVKKNQAYLRKTAINTGAELVEAIEAVLRDRVTKEYRHDLASNRPFSSLSQRQISTLQLVAEGKTNAQIASIRGTTVRAVEGMLTRIFEVLDIDPKGSNPRVEATARYHQLRSQVESVA
ncbi:MAG: DNA-binding response regulator [Actinobacteria bacterium]|nr:DNA-binding response regulator [Actinomycetota bacterium]